MLRWHTQLGVLPIPKSSNAARRAENLDIAGFTLDEADMASIGQLPQRRLGGDPRTHEEF